MTGILVVIALILITCTIANYRRGLQPRLLLCLSIILVATIVVGVLGSVMRSHPFGSMLTSLALSIALYYVFRRRREEEI